MKDKTITFRHFRKVEALFGTVKDEELKEKLVEDCFNRGYVPMEGNFETYEPTPFNKIRRYSCWCGYAGKKQAREIGEVKRPTEIVINNY